MPSPALASTISCTGCAACANRCPHNAIHMLRTEDGFYRPEIDSSQCIGCGACVKACPALQNRKSGDAPATTTCYTGWITNDEKRKASSSGGAFTALAEQILSKGGCIYGVALQHDLEAAHTCVEEASALAGIRGSKYIPSRVGLTFREAEKQLKKGRLVLFSGTPCEIAGLKSYLRKEYANLFTCDFSCHGTPSLKLFEKYVSFINREAGDSVKHILFRDK